MKDVIHTINAVKVKDDIEVMRLKTSTNYILEALVIVNHLNHTRYLMLHYNITREDLHTMNKAIKKAVSVSNVFPKCMLNSDFKAYYQGTPIKARVLIENNLCKGLIWDEGKDCKLEKEDIPVLAVQMR